MKVTVEVQRTITCEVEVEVDQDLADDEEAAAEAAIEQVEKASFPLPPMEEWSALKDWKFTVYDADGEPVAEG